MENSTFTDEPAIGETSAFQKLSAFLEKEGPMPLITLAAFIGFSFLLYITTGQGYASKHTPRTNERFVIPRRGGALQQGNGSTKLTLSHKVKASSNSFILKFALDDAFSTLGLPIGKTAQVVSYFGSSDHCELSPISDISQKGSVEFLISTPSAAASNEKDFIEWINELAIGSKITVRGPCGSFLYEGFGRFISHGKLLDGKTNIGLIAARSGITSAFQIAWHALKGGDGTLLSLLFEGKSEDEIPLQEELTSLSKDFKTRFSLCLTVQNPPGTGWPHSIGPLNPDMLSKHLPYSGENCLIVVAGPLKFKAKVAGQLKQLGFQRGQYELLD